MPDSYREAIEQAQNVLAVWRASSEAVRRSVANDDGTIVFSVLPSSRAILGITEVPIKDDYQFPASTGVRVSAEPRTGPVTMRIMEALDV